MFVQSTSSALVATSRTKFQGFRRGFASRKQPSSTPPATTSVHVYAQQHHSKTPQVTVSTIILPFEPRPAKFTQPSKTWRFLNPSSATLPRLPSWSRTLHSQIVQSSSGLPKLLPPSIPTRSTQRAGLSPAPLMIRKDSGRLGMRTSFSSAREKERTGMEIMTKCVYMPWLIQGESAESHEWNAFLSNPVGHQYCKDLHW
ncbi:hypothetical protein K504DRAFT_170293 [Pleomassaria siparia CBS 279.74]|uniref:Uncharacterized protein n=1 Tax=Pleomassaria siparia CBS 279.74 TaxID=1314801 RepID=A0A6G1JTY1_9PLEO|nr:hypothetical protein K504DRAFT_170293 [Pleomassaria siparia CBS 279.74]